MKKKRKSNSFLIFHNFLILALFLNVQSEKAEKAERLQERFTGRQERENRWQIIAVIKLDKQYSQCERKNILIYIQTKRHRTSIFQTSKSGILTEIELTLS